MIVSASRRTDIPRYFAPWLMNRLRAGYALTRNPMNPRQVTRVPLTPDIADCLVLWSKDPAPLLPRLKEMSALMPYFYFQFTLTPYGPDIERGLRHKADILRAFLDLSDALGPHRVLWRYDPIILSDTLTVNWHAERFSALCAALAGHTSRVTISFVDDYAKNKAFRPQPIAGSEMARCCAALVSVADAYHLPVLACCEGMDLTPFGVGRGRCVDADIAARVRGRALKIPADKNQRPGCGCCQSVDIGAYDTCPAGCAYCYATRNAALSRKNFLAHDQEGEMLLGRLSPGDAISGRAFVSCCL